MAFDWFKRKGQNITTSTEDKKDVPKGLWHKTPTGKIIEAEELKAPVAAGTEVILTAGDAPEGKTFAGWKR